MVEKNKYQIGRDAYSGEKVIINSERKMQKARDLSTPKPEIKTLDREKPLNKNDKIPYRERKEKNYR